MIVDTFNATVDTLVAAVRVDTTRSVGDTKAGGYALPFTEDTKSADVETEVPAVRVDTTGALAGCVLIISAFNANVTTDVAAVRLDTTRSAGTEAAGGYAAPFTDDTKSAGVDTELAAVRVDTTAFAGGSNTGGYALPLIDDTPIIELTVKSLVGMTTPVLTLNAEALFTVTSTPPPSIIIPLSRVIKLSVTPCRVDTPVNSGAVTDSAAVRVDTMAFVGGSNTGG